ncbi:MAG: hypothetical protein KDC95_05215 [Planctomycetes bacterium]|nr:hypothetical protein [Planctomycetota bacterium]
MADDVSLSFVLLSEAALPDVDLLVSAAAALGESVTADSGSEREISSFDLDGGGSLLIMLVDFPHPDAARMRKGLASPSDEEIDQMVAHYIVTATGLSEDAFERDVRLAKLTAAILRSSPAIAAMLGKGVVFHKAEFFANAVESSSDCPLLVCVDVTFASEGDERISMLTHGLVRYGREEFYVTASRHGKGGVDFILNMASWMLQDREKHLPTGDTVGRTAEEKIVVQRVPNPTGDGPEVIRLDLDAG